MNERKKMFFHRIGFSIDKDLTYKGNDIKPKGTQMLKRALKTNTTLTSLPTGCDE